MSTKRQHGLNMINIMHVPSKTFKLDFVHQISNFPRSSPSIISGMNDCRLQVSLLRKYVGSFYRSKLFLPN